MTESPASVIGTWDLTIKTPIGTQLVVLQLSDVDGVVEGVAAGAHESVPIRDLVITGDTMAWQQSITKPIRLNLTFEVDVIGDARTIRHIEGRETPSIEGHRDPPFMINKIFDSYTAVPFEEKRPRR